MTPHQVNNVLRWKNDDQSLSFSFGFKEEILNFQIKLSPSRSRLLVQAMNLACISLPPIFCNKRAHIFGVQKLPLFDPVQERVQYILS